MRQLSSESLKNGVEKKREPGGVVKMSLKLWLFAAGKGLWGPSAFGRMLSGLVRRLTSTARVFVINQGKITCNVWTVYVLEPYAVNTTLEVILSRTYSSTEPYVQRS